MSNVVGRPEISSTAKELLFQKLEPYLHSGISLRKACKEANVSRAWVYTLIQRDDNFADQITRAKEYLCAYLHTFLFRLISSYCYKIFNSQRLQPEEMDFLKWYALHANIMSEEFGRRINTNIALDPEMEFRRFKQILVRNKNLQS